MHSITCSLFVILSCTVTVRAHAIPPTAPSHYAHISHSFRRETRPFSSSSTFPDDDNHTPVNDHAVKREGTYQEWARSLDAETTGSTSSQGAEIKDSTNLLSHSDSVPVNNPVSPQAVSASASPAQPVPAIHSSPAHPPATSPAKTVPKPHAKAVKTAVKPGKGANRRPAKKGKKVGKGVNGKGVNGKGANGKGANGKGVSGKVSMKVGKK